MNDLLEFLKFANDNNLSLSLFAPRIINNSLKSKDCPCDNLLEQIDEKGECECKLFQRKV